jgi:hypothetical protein
MKPNLKLSCLSALLWGAAEAWAQDATPAGAATVDPVSEQADEDDGKAPVMATSAVDALQPEVVPPPSTVAVVAPDRATYIALVASLQGSLARATAAIAAARVALDDATQRRSVARLDVGARQAELIAAKAQHKVEVLADSGADERAAQQAVEAAAEAVRAAEAMVRVRTEEIAVAGADLDLAKGIADLESAKLEEAKARTIEPPLPVSDLLKLEKVRVLAQTTVARLRARQADARAAVERVRP